MVPSRSALPGARLSWDEVIILDNRVGVSLIAQTEVAEVNFRVTADGVSTVYPLGRARSPGRVGPGARRGAGDPILRQETQSLETAE